MKAARALDVGVNISILAFILFVLLIPGGPIRTKLDAWRAHRESVKAIHGYWGEMAGAAEKGKVVLVEFSDYQCPFCRDMYASLAAASQTGLFSVVHLHFPLSQIHPYADGAARAAICAEGQNMFEEMHHQLMTTDSWMSVENNWPEIAIQVGIADVGQFSACLESAETTTRLERDGEIARSIGVRPTPTYVAPGGLHRGIASQEELEALLAR